MAKTPNNRLLGEELMFAQDCNKKELAEAKAKIVPFKTAKSKNTIAICISQAGDFVLVKPETLRAILEWYEHGDAD